MNGRIETASTVKTKILRSLLSKYFLISRSDHGEPEVHDLGR